MRKATCEEVAYAIERCISNYKACSRALSAIAFNEQEFGCIYGDLADSYSKAMSGWHKAINCLNVIQPNDARRNDE